MEDRKHVAQLLLKIEEGPIHEKDLVKKASTAIFITDMGRNVIPENSLVLVVGNIRKTPTSRGKC